MAGFLMGDDLMRVRDAANLIAQNKHDRTNKNNFAKGLISLAQFFFAKNMIHHNSSYLLPVLPTEMQVVSQGDIVSLRENHWQYVRECWEFNFSRSAQEHFLLGVVILSKYFDLDKAIGNEEVSIPGFNRIVHQMDESAVCQLAKRGWKKEKNTWIWVSLKI